MKDSVEVVAKGKTKLKGETNLKTRLQGMFHCFMMCFWSSVKLLKLDIISFLYFLPLFEVILLKNTTVSDDYSSQATISDFMRQKYVYAVVVFIVLRHQKHFISLEN